MFESCIRCTFPSSVYFNGAQQDKCRLRPETDSMCSVDAWHLNVKGGGGREECGICRTVGLVSSIGRAPDSQAGGRRFVLHRAYFSSLHVVYFTIDSDCIGSSFQLNPSLL